MNKKYLSFISLASLLILCGGLLTGCGTKPDEESADLVNEGEAPTETIPTEVVPTKPETAPVITDSELDQEISNIDADLKTVETTGFEATSLVDKDLGI